MRIEDIPRAPERLSLLELRPKKVMMPLPHGREIEVSGLSAADIADLMERYEPLRKIMMQAPVTTAEIIAAAPGAMKSIIACGCGYRGNADAEAAAAALTIEEQSEIVEGIARCTFTRGFGPFVSRIQALGIEVSEGGRAQAMGSPRTSPPSSSPASPKPGHGVSPPASSPPTSSSPSEIASAA